MVKIRLFREKEGLSQRELAAAIGVSQAAVAQWETGAVEPTLDNLRKAAEVLNCKPGDLV